MPPNVFGGVDMFYFLFTILAHVLSWMFVIGLVGTVLLVIPTAAYQLLSALFQKDRPEEINPRYQRLEQ